ncbi:MAG: tlde1 domain-containing protein [Methylovirgula sp.]
MTYWTYAPQDYTSFNRRGFFRRVFSEAAPGAVVLGLAALAGAWIVYVHPDAQIKVVEAPIEAPTLEAPSFVKPQVAQAAAATPAAPMQVAANVYSPFIDPTFSLKAARASFAQSEPLAPTFGADPEAVSPPSQQVAAVPVQFAAIPMPPVEPQSLAAPQVPADDVDTQDKTAQDDQSGKENMLPFSGDQKLAASAPLPPAHMVASVPLPAPRPDGLVVPEAENHTRVAVRQAPQPKETTQVAAAPTPPQDHNSFFDKLFGGVNRPSGQALAYAEPEDGVADTSPRSASAGVAPYDHYTAVYNIATHTVYLPDGRRLEAHSGLGEAFDDPRYVRQKMRGPTPPGIYDLKPREQLFHGVAALRLIPVGNADPYGRVGLLAHRFMLGPRGDSNGCVSFRDYPAFLDAYRNGEIRRLVVVAGL